MDSSLSSSPHRASKPLSPRHSLSWFTETITAKVSLNNRRGRTISSKSRVSWCPSLKCSPQMRRRKSISSSNGPCLSWTSAASIVCSRSRFLKSRSRSPSNRRSSRDKRSINNSVGKKVHLIQLVWWESYPRSHPCILLITMTSSWSMTFLPISQP